MEVILKYFKNLNEQQIEKFRMLQPLYLDWNEKINVISRKDVQFLYERHVLHSLAISKVLNFESGSMVLDVGTGGGFPGIPLAIMYPKVQFHLIDSIGKKIKVVKEISNALGLVNIEATHQRVQENKLKYDFITSRAVTNMFDFVQMTKGRLKKESKHKLKNGILYLKGGDFIEELEKINYKHTVYKLSDFFNESFFETKKLVHIY